MCQNVLLKTICGLKIKTQDTSQQRKANIFADMGSISVVKAFVGLAGF